MTFVTKTLGVRREPDGIVHEAEITTTHVMDGTVVTKAWLDADRVHLWIGDPPSKGFGIRRGGGDSFAPDDAEHLANLLLELARQARAVQARKPWTGGPLAAFSSRRG